MTQVRDDGGSEPGGSSAHEVIRLDSACKWGREATVLKSKLFVEMLEAWRCHRWRGDS